MPSSWPRFLESKALGDLPGAWPLSPSYFLLLLLLPMAGCTQDVLLAVLSGPYGMLEVELEEGPYQPHGLQLCPSYHNMPHTFDKQLCLH